MSGRQRSFDSRRRWAACAIAAGVGFACSTACAQFPDQFFEGSFFPEEFCWSDCWEIRPPGPIQGERSIENGWFIQTVRLPEGWPEPTGEYNFYRMELDRFFGVDAFFVEWRAITDNPGWLIDPLQVVAAVSAAGKAGVLYHTTMTDSAAALTRFYFPRVTVPISAGEPHTYRIEVYREEYIWYIDGAVAASGIPEGPYPDANAFLVWGAAREYVNATTAWDYVRAGEVPLDGSGDYDASGWQDMIDYFFVHDCLTKDGPGLYGGPGEDAGPGCRALDMDSDADVDLRDFAAFQNLYWDIACEPFCMEKPCSTCLSPPRDP